MSPLAELEAARSIEQLNGRQKAAVLMVSLGAERAAEVFRYLKKDEIEHLSLEMAKTPHVGNELAEGVLGEVIDTSLAQAYLNEGGVEFARDVLEKALGGDRAAEILGRLSAVIERRPFEFLRRTSPEQIYAFLRQESPQTIALVVANLHTTLAAQVLAQLPVEEQAEVAARIATMAETNPEVVEAVEHVMRQKLSNVATADYSAAGGIKSLAQILNQVDRPTERNVLEQLQEQDAELADEIRSLLFTFEDLKTLDDRSIQLVLRDVDQKDLALALRGVSDEVREKIFTNMSQRGSEMLREEMEVQPPQKKRAVEEAQGRIVAVVRRLEEAGVLVIARAGSEDVV